MSRGLVSRTVINRIAREEGVDPALFQALVTQESGRRKVAGSPAGAQGPSQLMPATARGLGVNINDPVDNLRGGARYLRTQLKTFGGNVDKALAAYNAGPGAVQKYGGVPPYAETQAYVRNIRALRQQSIVGGRRVGGASGPALTQPGAAGARPGPGGTATVTVTPGAATLTQEPGVASQPGSDGLAALGALLAQQQDPPRPLGNLSVPDFAARPVLPAGFQPSAATASLRTQPIDTDALLRTIQATSGGNVPQAPRTGVTVGAPTVTGSMTAGAPGAPRGRTLVIGDSLGVGTVPFLKRALGGAVDASVMVGRSSSRGIQALRQKLAGANYGQIVLDLGTNDGSARELAHSVQEARRLAPNAQIYIPTVNGPGAAQKNRTLRRLAGGNVHVVPWNAQLAGDGIHATGRGYRSRAQTIAAALGVTPAAGGGGPRGHLAVAAGAERRPDGRTVRLQPVTRDFLELTSGVLGRTLRTQTVSNHHQFVSGRPGVQSDHWEGKAVDLGSVANGFQVNGEGGTRIAAAALVATGVPPRKARQMAERGGYMDRPWKGGIMQIIWRAPDGSHRDHVHIGWHP